MRLCHEEGAGIGDARAPGVGQESEIMAVTGRRQQFGAACGLGSVAQFHDVDLPDRQCRRQRLQERARGLGVFHDEVGEAAGHGHRVRRQHVLGRDEAEQIRHHEKAAQSHERASTLTPATRSMRVSRMSGRPISAVGSSLSMLSKRAMPSASERTLPAQS